MSHFAIVLLALLPSPGLSPAEFEARTRTLPPDSIQQTTLEVEERHVWRISVGAGQRVGAEIITDAPGLHVRLLDEAGRQVLARDQAPGADTLSWISTARGKWTIELTPLPIPSPSPAPYVIWLPVMRGATDRDREEWERDLLAAQLLGALEEGSSETAQEILQRMLESQQKKVEEDPAALAKRLETLSDSFTIVCDDSTATDLLGRALAIREAAQGTDHLDVASTLNRLATSHFYLGQWDLGEMAEQRALDIRLQHFARRPKAESYRDLGSLYYYEGRYREATASFRQALNLFKEERPASRADIAHTLGFLAEAYTALGEYGDAQSAINTAADEARSLQQDAPEIYALVLNNRAKLKHSQGRDAEARSDLRQAHEIFSRLEGYPSDLAAVTMNLADLDRAQKDFAAAEKGFQQALELAEQALCPGHPDLLWYLNQYALSLAEQSRHEEAEPLFRRALTLAEDALEGDHPMIALTLHYLADTLGALTRYAEADQLSLRALTIREKILGVEHPEAATSRVQRARLAFQRSKNASEEILTSVTQATLLLERTILYPEQSIEAYSLLADLLHQRSEAPAARQALATALDLIDAQRLRAGGGDRTRSDFMKAHVKDFLRMVEWQLAAGEVETALVYTERYRARVLQDQLAASGLNLLGGGGSRLATLEQRRAKVQARIAELHRLLAFTRSRNDFSVIQDIQKRDRRTLILGYEADLEVAYSDYESATEELKNESPRWRSVDGQTVSSAEIRKVVPEGGLLLVYQFGEKSSHLFLVPPSPGRPEVHPLDVPDDAAAVLGIQSGPLTTTVRDLFSIKNSPSPDEASRNLHALWKILVPHGLWARLEAAKEVVVIPDRWLHGLPFEVLVVAPGSAPGEERFWLDAGPPVRYAPSVSSLHALYRRTEAGDDSAATSVLTVADPIYDPADLSDSSTVEAKPGDSEAEVGPEGRTLERPLDRLPRTADETRAIREVFREIYGDTSAEVLALLREQATESRVRLALPGKRFIHFGTHGIVTAGRELFAGLALAPSMSASWPTEDDGFLQLFEIYDLPISADLVVLSACDTQVGHAIEGEGVFALSRGFLAAGGQRVVASLWMVEEDSTAALMESFFRRVLGAYREGRPIRYSEALRDAKQEIRSRLDRPEWSASHFWAPFVLTGIE